MKKLILLFAIVAINFAAKAQVNMINPNALALDTASQAADEGPKTVIMKGTVKTFAAVLKTIKLTGTIAGSAFVQVSNNGTDWSTLATITLVDASTNYNYKEVDKGFLYYRFLIHQTGTSSLSYAASYYIPPNSAGQR